MCTQSRSRPRRWWWRRRWWRRRRRGVEAACGQLDGCAARRLPCPPTSRCGPVLCPLCRVLSFGACRSCLRIVCHVCASCMPVVRARVGLLVWGVWGNVGCASGVCRVSSLRWCVCRVRSCVSYGACCVSCVLCLLTSRDTCLLALRVLCAEQAFLCPRRRPPLYTLYMSISIYEYMLWPRLVMCVMCVMCVLCVLACVSCPCVILLRSVSCASVIYVHMHAHAQMHSLMHTHARAHEHAHTHHTHSHNTHEISLQERSGIDPRAARACVPRLSRPQRYLSPCTQQRGASCRMFAHSCCARDLAFHMPGVSVIYLGA
jgi:hypothetical protein